MKLSSALVLANLTSTAGFIIHHQSTTPFVRKHERNIVAPLDAAPTMVIYWSIKTAVDTIRYAAGQTDEVKGTGVWSAFELKRDKDDDDANGNAKEQKKGYGADEKKK